MQPNTDSIKDEAPIEAKRENLKLRAKLRSVIEERELLKVRTAMLNGELRGYFDGSAQRCAAANEHQICAAA